VRTWPGDVEDALIWPLGISAVEPKREVNGSVASVGRRARSHPQTRL